MYFHLINENLIMNETWSDGKKKKKEPPTKRDESNTTLFRHTFFPEKKKLKVFVMALSSFLFCFCVGVRVGECVRVCVRVCVWVCTCIGVNVRVCSYDKKICQNVPFSIQADPFKEMNMSWENNVHQQLGKTSSWISACPRTSNQESNHCLLMKLWWLESCIK